MAVFSHGCFSFEKSNMKFSDKPIAKLHEHGGTPDEHVFASNYGWYLFNVMPIVCGNAREGAVFPWSFFCNEVDETVIQNRITSYAAERGCDVADINIFNNEQVLLDIYSIPVPIPYVCCYREMQISGVLVKPAKVVDEDERRAMEMKQEMKRLLERTKVEEMR